ncbi:MAG TPA: peptide chain release factor N(5)-glutamine methyltransferase [Terriglobales bacterium]|nr:peptide chain release factor N(5)-glutamine methyltransferase [Terriglobales bacterium]
MNAVQVREALSQAIQHLTARDVPSPRLNAETLLMFTLGRDRAYLYAHPERELTAEEASRYDAALAERARGVPAQYITGHQEFWGLDFVVTPAVLIPRPETEHVVETVLALRAEGPEGLRIADVGTGSGCIALALAKEFPRATVTALDISPAALEVARINATRLEMSERVRFVESDLLGALPASEQFELIVCNPPYVGENEADKVQRQVREFEPRVAVFAGKNGLDVYERLVPQARERLAPGGWLVMEIGYSIEAPVRALLGGWSDVRVTNDLQGIPRVVAAKKPT